MNESFKGDKIIYAEPRIVEVESVNGSEILIRKVISV